MTHEELRARDAAKIKEYINTHNGIAKTSELYTLGIDFRRIQTFVKNGLLTKVRSGYYVLKDEKNDDAIIFSVFGEDGVLTMSSALYALGYIKKKPDEYDIAVDKNTSKSRFNMEYPFIRAYYTSHEVLYAGTKYVSFGGGEMRCYGPERTICDCLKYEDKIDRETLREALKGYINDPNKDTLELLEMAKERKVLSKVRSMLGVWL